ncbi:unnamed protein product [Amoebophrya sp. A120]|nr:unnamed protein product [Amoebophrya sp. A120]|eukprot:GSA120T00009400001.1
MADISSIELQDYQPGPVVMGALGQGESGLRQRTARSNSNFSELTADLPLPFETYSKMDVLTQRERIWISRLVVTSLLDVPISFFVSVIAFSTAYKDIGVSLYCIGIQALAHCLASFCTVCRFYKESRWGKYGERDGRANSTSTSGETNKSAVTSSTLSEEDPEDADAEDATLLTERRKDLFREQILSIAIGCTMLLSSVALLFKAARKYKFWDKWYEDHQQADETITIVCEVLAWKAGALYFLHAGLRFLARQDTIGHKFTNHIFWVSAVSSIYCFVLGVSASYQKEWSWKAEPIAATVLALGCILEGIRICYVYADDVDDLLRKHSRA